MLKFNFLFTRLFWTLRNFGAKAKELFTKEVSFQKIQDQDQTAGKKEEKLEFLHHWMNSNSSGNASLKRKYYIF